MTLHQLTRIESLADRRDEAAHDAAQVEAIAARVDDPTLLADALHDRADGAYRRGDLADAVALSRRALATGERRVSRSKLASLHGNLGSYLIAVRRNDEAVGELEKAVALVRAEYHGDNHPDVAIDLMNLANATYQRNQAEAAAALMKQAIAIFDRLVAPDAAARLAADQNYAAVLSTLGRDDDAIAILRAALPRAEAKVGPHANMPLGMRHNLGMALENEGKLDLALAMYRSEIALAPTGDNPRRVMQARYAVASVLIATDHAAEAIPELRVVLAFYEHDGGAQSYDAAFARGDLGRALLKTGDVGGAIDALVATMPEIDRDGGDDARGKYHYALAQARWAHGERELARAEAEVARAAFATSGPRSAADLATVVDWLAAHALAAHPQRR